MSLNSTDTPPRSWGFVVFIVASAVFALILLTACAVPYAFGPPSSSGEFGDMFGATNALFSGLALLGVVFAILMQREELQLQRAELKETRDELRGQKEQMELQNATMRRQAFDSTFFAVLRLHVDTMSGVTYNFYRDRMIGRDAFAVMVRRLKETYDHQTGPPSSSGKSLDAYAEFLKHAQHSVSYYFQSLASVFSLIASAPPESRSQYRAIARAQLSKQEVILVFYCGLYEGQYSPMYNLACEHHLFIGLTATDVLCDSDIAYYPDDAFHEHE